MARPKRPDWSKPLPKPLTIPGIMTIKTLADVRTLIKKLPKEFRSRSTWQYVEKQLAEGAAGADTVYIATALRMVLMLEKVECR